MLAKVATGLNQVSISKSLSTMYLMIRVRNWLLTWVGYRSEFFIYWPKDYYNASWLGVNIGSDFGFVAKSTIALLNSSPPAQNGHHFADNIFKHIFMNEEVFLFWFKFHRRQAIIWTNADPVHWRIYPVGKYILLAKKKSNLVLNTHSSWPFETY